MKIRWKHFTGKHFNPTWFTVVADCDIHQENLCEEQNRRLFVKMPLILLLHRIKKRRHVLIVLHHK